METLCLFIVVCLIVERNICMKKSGKCQGRAKHSRKVACILFPFFIVDISM